VNTSTFSSQFSCQLDFSSQAEPCKSADLFSDCIYIVRRFLTFGFLLKNNKTLIGLDVKDLSFLLMRVFSRADITLRQNGICWKAERIRSNRFSCN